MALQPVRRTKIFTVDNKVSVSVLFDCTVSLRNSKRVRATQYEVETGANITDHIIKEPEEYSLQVVFSDTPIEITGLPASAFGGVAFSDDNAGRSAQIYDVLKRLCDDGRLIAIDNPLILSSQATVNGEEFLFQPYAGQYVITSVSTTKTSATGASLSVDLDIQEIRTVSSLRTKIPKSLLALRKSGKNSGKVESTAASPGQNVAVDKVIKRTTLGDRFVAPTVTSPGPL